MRVTLASRFARLALSRPTATATATAARLLAVPPPVAGASRTLATSVVRAQPASKVVTADNGGIGSGQGGKADKEQARRDKEARAVAKALKTIETAKAKAKALKAAAKARATKAAAPVKPAKVAVVKKPKSTLHPPKVPSNAWILFLTDFTANRKASLQPGEKLPTATTMSSEAAPAYRNLDPTARAALLVRHQELKNAYPAQYEAWKATLTPQMIKEENLVRFRRRKLGLSHKANFRLEGEPKRPLSAYLRFSIKERKDLSHLSVVESSKVIAEAWRNVSAEEKKALEDEYAADRAKYVEDKKAWDDEQAAKSGTPPADE